MDINPNDFYQIWIRRRQAACSHVETVYLRARDQEHADEIAYLMFGDAYQIKAVLPMNKALEEEPCGCGRTITTGV